MKKILIVDDLKTFIEKEKSILSRSDFSIFTATSGEEALAIHRAERVDLIITDLDMPGISGDQLCSMLRKDGNLKAVSVILVCTASEADMKRFERCGANTYVTKPIRPLQLLEKVGQLLEIPERKSYRVLLKVTVNSSSPKETFYCSSQNISASGILIETEKTLQKGDIITCAFFLPNAGRVVTDGEVARVATNSDSAVHYGVRFMNITPEYKSAIEAFIKSRA